MGFKHIKKREPSYGVRKSWAEIQAEYDLNVHDDTQELRNIAEQLKRIADTLEKGE